jgi:hypothetical protein
LPVANANSGKAGAEKYRERTSPFIFNLVLLYKVNMCEVNYFKEKINIGNYFSQLYSIFSSFEFLSSPSSILCELLMIERLANENPATLACMHGSVWKGDGARLLRTLA